MTKRIQFPLVIIVSEKDWLSGKTTEIIKIINLLVKLLFKIYFNVCCLERLLRLNNNEKMKKIWDQRSSYLTVDPNWKSTAWIHAKRNLIPISSSDNCEHIWHKTFNTCRLHISQESGQRGDLQHRSLTTSSVTKILARVKYFSYSLNCWLICNRR